MAPNHDEGGGNCAYSEQSAPPQKAYGSIVMGVTAHQIEWAIMYVFVTPMLLRLGASADLASIAWIFGPVTCLVLSPWVGKQSDLCRSLWGRRRPYLVVTGTVITVCFLVIPFAAQCLTSSTELAIIVIIVALMMLDISNSLHDQVIRSLATDLAPPAFLGRMHSFVAASNGLGSTIGNLMGTIDYSGVSRQLCSDTVVFVVATLVFVVGWIVMLILADEVPLEHLEVCPNFELDQTENLDLSSGDLENEEMKKGEILEEKKRENNLISGGFTEIPLGVYQGTQERSSRGESRRKGFRKCRSFDGGKGESGFYFSSDGLDTDDENAVGKPEKQDVDFSQKDHIFFMSRGDRRRRFRKCRSFDGCEAESNFCFSPADIDDVDESTAGKRERQKIDLSQKDHTFHTLSRSLPTRRRSVSETSITCLNESPNDRPLCGHCASLDDETEKIRSSESQSVRKDRGHNYTRGCDPVSCVTPLENKLPHGRYQFHIIAERTTDGCGDSCGGFLSSLLLPMWRLLRDSHPSFALICAAQFTSYIGMLSVFIYTTAFFAESVFDGDPTASPDSDAGVSYSDGVRRGALASAAMSVTAVLGSAAVPGLVQRLDVGGAYATMQLPSAPCLLTAYLVKGEWSSVFLVGLVGLSWSSNNSICFSYGCLAVPEKDAGLATSVLYLTQTIPILFVSLVIGPLIRLSGNDFSLPFLVSSISFATAGVMGLFLLKISHSQ